MRTLKLILLGLTMFTFFANAQTTKPKSIIVIDGYFFNEMPVSKQNIAKMHMLQTPNGTKALGLELNEELTDEALKFAIPKESVPDADILLQKYNEAKGANSSISLSVTRQAVLNVGDKSPSFTSSDIDGKQWTDSLILCWLHQNYYLGPRQNPPDDVPRLTPTEPVDSL